MTGSFGECPVPEIVEAEIFTTGEATGFVPTPALGGRLAASRSSDLAVERTRGEVPTRATGKEEALQARGRVFLLVVDDVI